MNQDRLEVEYFAVVRIEISNLLAEGVVEKPQVETVSELAAMIEAEMVKLADYC
jgi:hypothetical protein